MEVTIELNTAEINEHIKISKSDGSDTVYISATLDNSTVGILAATNIEELEKIINLLKQVHP